MSDEEIKPGNEKALSPNQSLSEAIKDKIFNKIYFYILVSFLLINWQEILILFKSNEDIFYTLSIIFTSQMWFDYMLPAWFAHFGLPILFGTLASALTPFVTYWISKVTAKRFAKIRRADRKADLEVEDEFQDLRIKLVTKTNKADNLLNRINLLEMQNATMSKKNTQPQEHRRQLFFGIKAFVDYYETKGELKTPKGEITTAANE
ncbi:hypothetical protein M8320_18520 [Leclercia sp. H6W5]|uniref:hypothetical protein n=1 Tax=Leclercia tamurae TaxID=2926467 RepID=UPI0021CF0FF0|nr:hypothetical protein [Leclercia tamurae]MCU6683990.1 hypothetical protein [Leclercia tamurae]